MKKLLSVITLSAVFALSSLEVAQSASIFEPARDKQYCSTALPQYPGFPPKQLNMDFSDYQAIYNSDIDNYMHSYSEYIQTLTEAATISINAADRLRREVVKNAKQRTLNYDPTVVVPPIYYAILVMTPLTIAYAQHRNEYSLQEQKDVEAWISFHIKLITRNDYFSGVQSDNKKYFYGVWLAAFGKATNEAIYIERAKQIYQKAIELQREDGSLLNDSQRGGCAIHYTASAVSSLVTLAEILSDKNVDYYSYRVGRKSLKNIITFLLEATRHNQLIADYAADPEWSKSCFPGYSPERQDVSWTTKQMANWGYYYINRLPNTPVSKKLLNISAFLRNGMRGYDATAAGNPVCYLGKVPR